MFRGGRCFCPQLEFLPKGRKMSSVPVGEHQDTTNVFKKIRIHPRIERGPTDILKALSATIKQNTSSSHYKYPDDPFFYPCSNLSKRRLALAMESGRKSARWIVQNNPTLFQTKIADPFIKAYLPKPDYTTNSQVTEDLLVDLIKNSNIRDAETVYNILKGKGIEISKDTKQLLLELVCFFNDDEKLPQEDLEMKWFQALKKEEKFKTWKDNGFAEELFKSMGMDCPLAVSAIIKGRLKYCQIEKGVELYEYAIKNDIKLPLEVYNELLSRINFIRKDSREVQNYVLIVLRQMAARKINPNLNTLNAILKGLFYLVPDDDIITFSWKVYTEFLNLGIEPSLGTYYYLLCTLFKNQNFYGKAKYMLVNTISSLKEKNLELRHPSDLSFFPNVMLGIALIFKSPSLSDQLHELLMDKDNTKFLSKSLHESIYYRSYFIINFEQKSLAEAMKIYNQYVPWKYSPELMVLNRIFKEMSKVKDLSFLPKIWDDLINLNLSNQILLVEKIISMVSLCNENTGDEILKTLQQVAAVGLSLVENETKSDTSLEVGDINRLMSDIFTIYVLSKDDTEALKIFNKFTREGSIIEVNVGAMQTCLNYCISTQNHSLILEILKYAENKKYPEAPALAESSLPHLSNLAPTDLKWVTELAGRRSQTSGPNQDMKR